MGRPHTIEVWVEEAVWIAVVLVVYIINLIQVVSDAREDALAKDK
jgi:hypothetical protein